MKQPKWVLYRLGGVEGNEWYWRFVSANGRILADSGESYKRIGSAMKAIKAIQAGVNAEVEIKK